MVSPVSFGDAFLMAKLAMTLGRAFTKGRKSAPLSSALKIDLARLLSLSQERQSSGADVLDSMFISCKEILVHLEKLVETYSSLRKPRDPGAPVTRKWKQELKDSWKKIAWTTEGGDLAILRSQLTVHTNRLNLILTVVTHTKTDRVEHGIG
ncbi:hypothetical protein MFIFM68171_02104 [Madurella fahalii]|uniref:Uncharacterized protein n=1 Tax=Madurella fahalii TaxID=1157608 RepID=A0ABQ0G2I4_9PEZI